MNAGAAAWMFASFPNTNPGNSAHFPLFLVVAMLLVASVAMVAPRRRAAMCLLPALALTVACGSPAEEAPVDREITHWFGDQTQATLSESMEAVEATRNLEQGSLISFTNGEYVCVVTMVGEGWSDITCYPASLPTRRLDRQIAESLTDVYAKGSKIYGLRAARFVNQMLDP